MEKTMNTSLNRILKEAKVEFMEKGYPKASLREIMRKAGLTTGAFYGYFTNKRQLYDALVEDVYYEILKIYVNTLKRFFEYSPKEQCDQMNYATYQCMLQLRDYMYEHYDVIKMILCCSEGTHYNNLIHQMAELDLQATHDFAKTMQLVGNEAKGVNPVLERVLTEGMFQGFFDMIIYEVPREATDEYIEQLLDFYTSGWGKLMGF